MALNNKYLLLFLILCSTISFAGGELLKENNKIFFKEGNSKFFLFDADNYCFDKDAFSVEKLTNDKKKYLFVNYTDDCNPSGKYEIFDISEKKAEKFYLSPLYDPEVDSNKKQIIEKFKDGAISYTRIYALKNGKYYLLEELKTLDSDLNLSIVYSGKSPIFSLKNDSNQLIKDIEVSSSKAYFFDENLVKTKSYIVRGDKVTVNNLMKKNNLIYMKVEFQSKNKITKGYIKLSDIL
ncbi:MAG: hypothetical protein KA277_10385 [Fusobacteriaceae bacterium]|nr:hypothetical protein [Fusobacteriaceae bacterium]MBP6468404.1 hypothetical protein [Fusobacteriaceae bacterium]